MEPFHPLDRLINDNSFALLEALVPFVDYPYKRLLVLYIKYKEALALMNCFNDRSFIARQGFDCHPKSTEDFVSDLCNILPTQYAGSLQNMKQLMQVMQMMDMKNPNTSGCFSNLFENAKATAQDFSNKTEHTSDAYLYQSVMDILNDNSS